MRLLKTSTLRIENFTDAEVPQYAILSHRWGQDEVLLHEVEEGILLKQECHRPGLKKARRFCSKAKSDGYEFAWMDTCCIDKTSSAELSEAINSMYRCYSRAEKCYAYLADILVMDQFPESDWFTRGFTLQELIAPSEVHFFSANWDFLGTKATLQQEISSTTNIPIGILSGHDDLETASIAQRMSWAAKRNTTRVEDRAYCLMGIFGIHMSLIYGEGERAFTRLQEEIMKVSDDQSLFAWQQDDSSGGLLADSPAAFESSKNIVPSHLHRSTVKPTVMSNLGTFLELPFMGIGPWGLGLAILNCKERGSQNERIAIYLRDVFWTMQRFERDVSCTYVRLKMQNLRQSQRPIRTLCIKTRRVFTVSRNKNTTKSNITEIYNNEMLMNMMDFDNPMALIQATRDGRENQVWMLLTRSDWEVDLEEPHQRMAFLHAVRSGWTSIVIMLLGQIGQMGPGNKAANTALLWVAAFGQEAIVKMLVDAESNTEIKDARGQTPLCVAARHGHGAIVKILVNAGAKVDAMDNTGRTPLSWAASNGYESPTLTLIDAGADLETKDTNLLTPLFWATKNEHRNIIRLLIEKGANLGVTNRHGQSSPLAAKQGNRIFHN